MLQKILKQSCISTMPLLYAFSTNFDTVVNSRRSIRQFKKEPIPQEQINKILELTSKCPTAGCLQAYKIYSIENAQTIKQIKDSSNGMGHMDYPSHVFVFCALPKVSLSRYKKKGQFFANQDATIACAYAQLAVESVGLAACWVGAFDDKKITDILKLDQDTLPVAILPVGIKNGKPWDFPKKTIKELVNNIK